MSSVSSSRSGDIVYLALRGELDTANIDELRDTAQQAVDAAGVTHVVVDLQQVTFMGATALGLLVGLRNDTTRRAITLTLRNVTPRSQRVLTITGLDRVFTIDQCDDTHDHQPPQLTQ